MRFRLLPPVLAATFSLSAAAQSKAPETYWDGEWHLVASESDRVDARIEEHVKGMNFAMKLLWKRRLQSACKTYAKMDLLLGTLFSMTADKELPADAPADGTAGEWKRSDGETFKVSMQRADGGITQVFRGDGYTLTYAFALAMDRGTLNLLVTYAHPKLSEPFSYRLVYRKAD